MNPGERMILEKSGCLYPIKPLCLMVPDSGSKVLKKSFLFFSYLQKAVFSLCFQNVFSFISLFFLFFFRFPSFSFAFSTLNYLSFRYQTQVFKKLWLWKSNYNMTAHVQKIAQLTAT